MLGGKKETWLVKINIREWVASLDPGEGDATKSTFLVFSEAGAPIMSQVFLFLIPSVK